MVVKIKKLLNLLRQKDFRDYLKYAFFHPRHAFKQLEYNQYPVYLRDIISEIDVYKDTSTTKTKEIYFSNEKQNQKFWKIRLAGIEIETFDIYNIDWHEEFADDEDVSALHRFIWLYNEVIRQIITNYDLTILKNDVISIILSWIQEIRKYEKKAFHSEVWQTYAVAERIVNWCFCFLKLKINIKEYPVIEESIKEQLYYICTNLEYFGDNYTGNHLSNSGKALYIGGKFAGVEIFERIGKRILSNEYKRIIIDENFLREGSTHYQFLVTKNYCDVLYIAKYFNDSEFIKEISEYVRNLLDGCKYFIYKTTEGWNIPKLGDISPDYSPEWLIGVPWAAKKILDDNTFEECPKHIGYHSAFINTTEEKFCGAINNKLVLLNRDWARINNQSFLLFAHVNNALFPNNIPGHFHHDSSGIVLLFKGEPIFVDCGRKTYQNNERSVKDKSFESHTLLSIDGMNPEPDIRTFFSDEYLTILNKKAPVIKMVSGNAIEIHNNGYTRLKNIDTVQRNIVLNDSRVKISDIVLGNKKHNLKIYFHTPLSVKKLDSSTVLLFNGEMNFELKSCIDNLKIKILQNEMAEAYGSCKMINTIVFEQIVKLPFENSFTLTEIGA